MSTEPRHNKKNSNDNDLKGWIRCIAIALIVGLFLRFFVIEFVNVSGESMTPGLQPGQIVFVEKVSKHFSEPEHGDVVIVKFSNVDSRYYVKRVMGLPGDTLAIKDGKVIRNGEVLDEPYIREEYIDTPMAEITVPAGHIFVMGDNRNDSSDSRSSHVGPIPEKDIVGNGVCVLFPFSDIKAVK